MSEEQGVHVVDEKPMARGGSSVGSSSPAGGGAWSAVETFAGVQLSPWPYWNQMADLAMDGDGGSGPNAANDCGPESVSMVLAYLTGVQLDADYIWDCIQFLRRKGGQSDGPGYTSIEDLTGYLETFCGMGTRVHRVDPTLSFGDARVWRLLAEQRAALEQGHPVIGLFSFSAPNAQDGHFRAVIGDTGYAVLSADPAQGFIPPHGPRAEGYRVWWSWSKGVVIGVRRTRWVLGV